MNPGRVNISLKTKIRREEREAASVRSSGQLGAQTETVCQPYQKTPVCITKTSKNKELMPDDPIQALMDDTPWWFTAFKNVYTLIPELGHSSRILDKQDERSVPLDLFLNRQPVIKPRPLGKVDSCKDPQSAFSSTEDIVNDLSLGPASKNYDIPQAIYSHVIRLTSRRPCRTGEEGTRGGEGEKLKETIMQSININPVLHFTLEEEFKVIDMIVRMEDFTVRHFAFMEKNFGSNFFPGYSQLTTENAAYTNFGGKLPYNPAMEQRLFHLGQKYINLNVDIFFNEMGRLSAGLKMKMLKNTYAGGLIILYSLLEYDNNMQPPPLGQEKVQQMRMSDLDRFTSPWALDYADEVKFYSTIAKVGEVIGRDLQLQALYTILFMVTPWNLQVSFIFLLLICC